MILVDGTKTLRRFLDCDIVSFKLPFLCGESRKDDGDRL